MSEQAPYPWDVFTHPVDLDQVPVVVELLGALVRQAKRIVHLEVTSDAVLERLEEEIAKTQQDKAHAHSLMAQRFSFEWWAVNGVWPRPTGPGWMLLLRRVTVQGAPRAAAGRIA